MSATQRDTAAPLRGLGVVPGLVSGQAIRMSPAVSEPPRTQLPPGTSTDPAAARIAEAATEVGRELSTAADRTSGTSAELLRTTAVMAADPALVAAAQALVRNERLTPESAVWSAGTALADQLAGLGGVLAERARDVRDVRDRIVAVLLGRPAPGIPEPGHPFVLVAHDLAPADTARLDAGRVLALVLSGGGATSHTAILARALGIPTVLGVAGADDIATGTALVVDAGAGAVHLDPGPDLVARAGSVTRRRRTFSGRCTTRDGRPVPLLANVGAPGDAAAAAQAGAEGVGLFRTEFCFLDRTEAPRRCEQVASYREVFAAFPARKVVVRTLDAGADKPLPFLGVPDEPNPALGVRGLRVATYAPEILDEQLAAIAEAAAAERAEVWVMAPMVSTAAEADAFVDRCDRYGLTSAGVMIEVPSAAILSRHLLRTATFASIGTNDLTQYAMAADRMLPQLASLGSAWQPAVLALVAQTCQGAAPRGRPVGVCGEAAADPALAAVLVGLGVSSLSMSASALADVEAVLARVDHDDCVRLAQQALDADGADQARQIVRQNLPALSELGL